MASNATVSLIGTLGLPVDGNKLCPLAVASPRITTRSNAWLVTQQFRLSGPWAIEADNPCPDLVTPRSFWGGFAPQGPGQTS